MIAKLINIIKSFQYRIFLTICIILISFISFNIGKIASNKKGSIKITEGLSEQTGANIYKAVSGDPDKVVNTVVSPTATPKPLDMRVVVSKASDSNKYHYTWCGSWKKIKPENQVWFNSDKEAEAAGYTLAGNCMP